ncbi:aspartyl-phosphate phosphatase Spo0E family protein [Texcoconibacillus texcoconensis]|uniref:Spo0E like sporulation regulatory protein n=1 Tax=Texcoconibacillus texcoconensis TaxID=1095777 RepID=A0A840QKK8_9BACI|nr:aspartyl-phosphate phosphatase Spo0E family protein [Texcoconibacillus texcoconensis]MBB5171897.1 hypothetical protein [Texcoconibacillus texcoconensis]
MCIKDEITQKKQELNELVKFYGFCSAQTLKCSQDLDKLIIEYQQQVQRQSSSLISQ